MIKVLLSAGGRVLPLAGSIASEVLVDNKRIAHIGAITGCALYLALDYLTMQKPLKNLKHNRKAVLDDVYSKWLKQYTYSLNGEDRQALCLNIMLLEGKWFRKLVQRYQNGMEDHPDRAMTLKPEKGIVGVEVIGDGTKPKKVYVEPKLKAIAPETLKDKYGFTKEDHKRTDHIEGIASIILVRSHVDEHGNRIFEKNPFGVLNVNALTEPAAAYLTTDEAKRQITVYGRIAELMFA